MLKEIHFLLTYSCNFECDHCFLFCGPNAEGTFTLGQLRDVFAEIARMKSINAVCFEGGEPFLYYPLLVEGIRLAREQGLRAYLVTNSYWATTVEDAELWLKPLAAAGLSSLSVSDDELHHGDMEETPAKRVITAAQKMKIPVDAISLERCSVDGDQDRERGEPVLTGGILYKGRAADKLIEGLPRRPWASMTTCPWEDLIDPQRVHVDSFGNVHLCQGISLGSMWDRPLSELVSDFRGTEHPICEPIIRGGPVELVRTFNLDHEETYVDECHLCFMARRALLDRFPQYLAPRSVYGR